MYIDKDIKIYIYIHVYIYIYIYIYIHIYMSMGVSLWVTSDPEKKRNSEFRCSKIQD